MNDFARAGVVMGRMIGGGGARSRGSAISRVSCCIVAEHEAAPATPTTARPPLAPVPLSSSAGLAWTIPLTVGATLLATAMVLRAVGATGGTRAGLLSAGAVLLTGPIYIALGIAAVAIAALALRRPLGSWTHAIGRMTAAVGLFHALVALGPLVIGGKPLADIVTWLVGALAYFVTIWGTFRLTRNNTLLVAAVHVLLWTALQGAIWAIPRLERAGEAAPAMPPTESAPAQTAPPPEPAP